MLENFVTYNGTSIPAVGLGTWQSKPQDAYNAVRWALEFGYRHIDTAFVYGNEREVGQAVRDSKIPRENVFVTTKVPAEIKSSAQAEKSFFSSLANLGTDYVDLYLIHAPWPWDEVGKDCTEGNIAVWEKLLELRSKGYVREVGVSNFEIADIEAVTTATGVLPAVNQIYHFVGATESQLRDYCQKRGIVVEAYSPLGTGKLLQNPALCRMAERYGVTTAQLCIRYCLYKQTLALPKSVHRDRIAQNISLDFEIAAEDVAFLDAFGNC